MKKIILLGAPGSGKGTLSEYLVEKFGFAHLSTGDIFRKNLELNTELADELRNYLPKGKLVPDELTNKVIEKEILDLNSWGKSFILDGYPRTQEQADFLSKTVTIDKVIFLDVDEKVLMERLTGRRTCSKCKRIYNVYSKEMQPKVSGICDDDQALLTQRKDDDEAVIAHRLEVYKQTTFTLVDYYKKKGLLVTVNGTNATKEEIHKEIDKIILGIKQG